MYGRHDETLPPVPPTGELDEAYALRVVFDSGLFALLCENLTSSTKPEVHNLLYCRQSRTEPWPQVTCIENLVIFVRVVFDICERTDKQTDKHTRWSQYFAALVTSCSPVLYAAETEKYRIKRHAGWHGCTGPRAADTTASAYNICSAYSCSVGRTVYLCSSFKAANSVL